MQCSVPCITGNTTTGSREGLGLPCHLPVLDLLPGQAGTVSADVLFLLTSPGSTGNVQGEAGSTLHGGRRRGGFWRLCAFLLKQALTELSLELLQNKLYHHRAGSCGSCKHSVAILLYQLVLAKCIQRVRPRGWLRAFLLALSPCRCPLVPKLQTWLNTLCCL